MSVSSRGRNIFSLNSQGLRSAEVSEESSSKKSGHSPLIRSVHKERRTRSRSKTVVGYEVSGGRHRHKKRHRSKGESSSRRSRSKSSYSPIPESSVQAPQIEQQPSQPIEVRPRSSSYCEVVRNIAADIRRAKIKEISGENLLETAKNSPRTPPHSENGSPRAENSSPRTPRERAAHEILKRSSSHQSRRSPPLGQSPKRFNSVPTVSSNLKQSVSIPVDARTDDEASTTTSGSKSELSLSLSPSRKIKGTTSVPPVDLSSVTSSASSTSSPVVSSVGGSGIRASTSTAHSPVITYGKNFSIRKEPQTFTVDAFLEVDFCDEEGRPTIEALSIVNLTFLLVEGKTSKLSEEQVTSFSKKLKSFKNLKKLDCSKLSFKPSRVPLRIPRSVETLLLGDVSCHVDFEDESRCSKVFAKKIGCNVIFDTPPSLELLKVINLKKGSDLRFSSKAQNVNLWVKEVYPECPVEQRGVFILPRCVKEFRTHILKMELGYDGNPSLTYVCIEEVHHDVQFPPSIVNLELGYIIDHVTVRCQETPHPLFLKFAIKANSASIDLPKGNKRLGGRYEELGAKHIFIHEPEWSAL